MPDDAGVFLVHAGQVPRQVDECHQRNVEGVAEPHESRRLVGGIDVQDAGKNHRLVGNDADGFPVKTRKPNDDVRRPVLVDLEKVGIVADGTNDVAHVIRLPGIHRDDAFDVVTRLGRSGGKTFGFLPVVPGNECEEFLDLMKALKLVRRIKMGIAGNLRVHARSAKVFHGDFFPKDGLDHFRTRNEHLGDLVHNEHEVSQCGRIDGPACARSQDHRDLRDDPRSEGIPVENLSVAGEGIHPLLNPCPS